MPCRTTARSTRPDKEDVKKVVSIVLLNKLLVEIGHREHRSFQNLKLNPLHKWDVKKSEEWIKVKIREYQKFKGNHCSEVSESEWWNSVGISSGREPRPVIFSHPMLKSVLVLGGGGGGGGRGGELHNELLC